MRISPLQLRLTTTLVLLPLLKIYKSPLVYPILSLFLLDYLDCGFYNTFIGKYNCKKGDEIKEYTNYQVKDKVYDLFAYFLFILLFSKELDSKTLNIILVLFLWRTIGVVLYSKTKNKINLKVFFDGINGVLILYLLSTHFTQVKENYNSLLIVTSLIKILFEQVHHK